jgi:hypothetical protein
LLVITLLILTDFSMKTGDGIFSLLILSANNDMSCYRWNHRHNISWFFLIIFILSPIPSLIIDKTYSIANDIGNVQHIFFVVNVIEHYRYNIFCQ